MDRIFFEFTGIDHEALLAEVKTGKSDSELLAWIRAHTPRRASEIHAWSAWLEQHGPGGAGGHEWLAETIKATAAARDDIRSYFRSPG